jgi:low molecular weight protein-tyrosine phosphatase
MRYIVAGGEHGVVIGHAGGMVTDSSASKALPAPRYPHRPYRICVVCLGNICRSPMAEVILRDELAAAGLAGKAEVDSAGTGDWHLGETMDSGARAELSRRGYDGSGHQARQIQPSWLTDYDLVLAMDRSNLASLRRMADGDSELAGRIRLMRSFDPDAAEQAEGPDPYNGGPEEYAQVFDLVEPAARGLASQLAALR